MFKTVDAVDNTDNTDKMMLKQTFFDCIFLIVILKSSLSSRLVLDPDEIKSFSELVYSHGYQLQEYKVLTEDNYIITVHRVVPQNFNPLVYSLVRKPVIAAHGILLDGASWFINSPFLHSKDSCGDNFGFCCIKSGRYDIFVTSARGSRYSDHEYFLKSDKEFFKYDWDHIAAFDIPAVVDFVRHITGHRTVSYVGFSQGGGTMFALLAQRPEFARIIRPFVAMAPAVFLGNMQSPMKVSLALDGKTLPHIPGQHMLSRQLLNDVFQYGLCRGLVGQQLCSIFLQVCFGASDSTNTTRLSVLFHHFPSPASNWQLAHFGQSVVTGKFSYFDFGSDEKNFAVYNQKIPPEYPLEQISPELKVAIIYGNTDSMVTVKDTRKLISVLRRAGVSVIDHKVPKKKWAHHDFISGTGAGKLVYDPTIRYLDMFAWD